MNGGSFGGGGGGGGGSKLPVLGSGGGNKAGGGDDKKESSFDPKAMAVSIYSQNHRHVYVACRYTKHPGPTWSIHKIATTFT